VNIVAEELQPPDDVLAEIAAHRGGFRFLFRLDDGREVVAVLPKRVAREMFRVVPGDRVWIAGADGNKPRITGFARSGHGE
jgi:translation initiation factor IF-1